MKNIIISVIKGLRAITTFWIGQPSYKHLRAVRSYEIQFSLKFIPSGVESIVEIGGGVGWQAEALLKSGYQVRSFDVESSNYAAEKNDLVKVYDGQSLPISDNSIDLIFSSNVLEHIPDTKGCLAEQHRVLQDGGYCLHILPSSSWRFWTSVTDLLKKWYLSPPQGELSSSIFQELFDFRAAAWVNRFKDDGFEVVQVVPGGIFYTGNAIFGERLGIKTRRIMANFLGSSCTYFLLKKK